MAKGPNMSSKRGVSASFLLVLGLGLTNARAEGTCPVTLPKDWRVSSDQILLAHDSDTHDWYGSQNLAALIPIDGKWIGNGSSFGNKFWWWRQGFDARQEPTPDLIISGVRLDGVSPPIQIIKATSGMGYGEGWHAMLVSMQFPSSGCWEIRGTYNGSQELILVLQVGEPEGAVAALRAVGVEH